MTCRIFPRVIGGNEKSWNRGIRAMADMISRKAVLELLQGWADPKAVMPYGTGYNAGVQDAIKAIQSPATIPSADAEPVRHGRWIGYDCTQYAGMDEYGEPTYKPHKEYKCSICGRFTVIHENYCPKCGAKMDEGEESHD